MSNRGGLYDYGDGPIHGDGSRPLEPKDATAASVALAALGITSKRPRAKKAKGICVHDPVLIKSVPIVRFDDSPKPTAKRKATS